MKKIANLEVFVSGDDNSFTQRNPANPENYRIILGTKSIGDLRSVFAHELGHFLAGVTNEPLHSVSPRSLSNFRILEAEEIAWKFAHVIHPALDKATEEYSLNSYLESAFESF